VLDLRQQSHHIEGNTRIAFTEDVAARFLGYQWNVLRVGDANDLERIEHALTCSSSPSAARR
jgi:transketolase